MNSDPLKIVINKQIIYNIYKEDMALNNLQWLIRHKTKSYIFNICIKRIWY